MKTFTTEKGIEIRIPENMGEITVNQFVSLQEINPENVESYEKVIEKMCKINPKELSFNDFIQISLLLAQGIATNTKKSFQKEIIIDGDTYTAKDLKDFSTREFIDFETIAIGEEPNKIQTLLALIYQEKEQEGEYVEAVRKRADIFGEKLDAETATAALSFFSKSLLLYVKDTLVCSEAAKKQMETNPKLKEAVEQLEALFGGGGGL